MLRQLLACHTQGGALFGIASVHIYAPYFPVAAGTQGKMFSHPFNPCQWLSGHNDMYICGLNVGTSHISMHRKLTTYT